MVLACQGSIWLYLCSTNTIHDLPNTLEGNKIGIVSIHSIISCRNATEIVMPQVFYLRITVKLK